MKNPETIKTIHKSHAFYDDAKSCYKAACEDSKYWSIKLLEPSDYGDGTVVRMKYDISPNNLCNIWEIETNSAIVIGIYEVRLD